MELSKKELQVILINHAKWLKNENEGIRANLSRKDLHGVNLNGKNLRGIIFNGANLQKANLIGTDLRYANLENTNLEKANLYNANLSNTSLKNAFLIDANLSYINLMNADLENVDLAYVNFIGANLMNANLKNANLKGTNLRSADLRNTNLKNVKTDIYTLFFNLQCPEEGSFIGWKRIGNRIIKLLIPENAERSSATTYKCRASKAHVLGIYDFKHNLLPLNSIVNNYYRHNTVYEVGKDVFPDLWDSDRWNECSHGIHFFINFNMAVNY